jgi:predicted secreted protein
MHRVLTLGFTGLLVLVTAGCLGPKVINVDIDAGSARLARGETLRVNLGEVNYSIGDQWYLVSPPDAAILAEKDQEYDSECANPGCGGRLHWRFTATGAGRTYVVFRYCYRTPPDRCAPAPNGRTDTPVALNVTVT